MGDPLIGASVVVKGTTTGVMVAADGAYTISAPPTATLIVSFVGYPNVEVAVNNRTVIDVTMSTEGQEIDEVVVVGYGTVKRANVTGAVSSINASEIQDIPVANLSKALEGRLAGVKVGQSSGKPGASTSLQIRESTSYSEATETPLYVIDGVIRDKEAFDMLDPNEVESISILKDASASVYGVRAAGGVVLVQTKRGKEGKIKVSYNGTTGITQAINVTEMLSAYDHATMLNDGYKASNISLTDDRYYSDDELRYFQSIPGGGYDWLEGAWETAMLTRHNLSVSGGSKTVRYYVGGSYYRETGAIAGLHVNKYSLRSNIEVDLLKGLTASFSVNIDNRDDRTPINPLDTQNEIMEETFRALLQNPKWIPPTINIDGIDYPVYQRGQIENNPYAIWANNEYKTNESSKAHYVAALDYKIPWIEGLSARLQLSQTKSNGYGKTYYEKAYAYNFQTEGTHNHIIRPDAPLVDSIPKQLVSSKESLEESSDRSFSYQFNASISYSRKIGLHDISALMVAEVSENESNRVGWQREGAQLVPNVDQLWAFQEKDRILATNVSAGGSLGYIGRLNYSYDNRYIGEFSFRYDASSKFSPDLRWGFFPAGAVGWIVSEESFFKENIDFIDFFKLRASAGLLGNDGVKDFLWKYSFGAITSSGVLFGNQPTNGIEAKNGSFANPDISWQKTQSYNGGFDVKLWDNRISVGFDGFYKYTYDILAPITNTNPTTVGIPTSSKIPFNYGIMHAYGCEIEVGYYNKLPFDINYYIKGNFAWSEARKLKVAQSPGAIGTWHDELKNNISNQPGAISTGIVRTDEEVQEILMDNPNYTVQAEPIQAGKLNYMDIRGADGSEGPNGVFSFNIEEDRTVIAALTSPPYTYGISLGLSWEGVRVDGTFSGKFGHNDFYNKDDHALPTSTRNVPSFWKDHWTPENTDAAYPRMLSDAMTEQHSTFWMVDGHTLRLTDLNVSYSLPSQWAERFKIPQLRIYFNTQNLWTVINPFDYKDANLSRYNGYPMTRTYTFGLNFTL
jgi:TonB-linked SusC/RagA family outer membrane protein